MGGSGTRLRTVAGPQSSQALKPSLTAQATRKSTRQPAQWPLGVQPGCAADLRRVSIPCDGPRSPVRPAWPVEDDPQTSSQISVLGRSAHAGAGEAGVRQPPDLVPDPDIREETDRQRLPSEPRPPHVGRGPGVGPTAALS